MRKEYKPARNLPSGRTVHENVLQDGIIVRVVEVRTHAGFRYCVTMDGKARELDDGVIYGEYEEAAAVFAREVVDDGESDLDLTEIF